MSSLRLRDATSRNERTMNYIEFNRSIRELENGCWRLTAFEDLQVQYCEDGLYALRCKLGTPNEHICLIREQSEDAAISRAVFDLHKRGEIDATVKALRAKLKAAEDALTKLQDRFVSSVHDGTIDPYEALKIAEDAIAAGNRRVEPPRGERSENAKTI